MKQPTTCNSCNGDVFKDKSRLYCKTAYSYKYCKESLANKIVNFAAGIQVKGIGLESALILAQQIKPSTDLSKVFGLSKDDLIDLLGKNGETIHKEIKEAIGTVKLYNLLGSMSMRNVSKHTAELIFTVVDINELLNSKNEILDTMDFDKSVITNIDGVGEITADSVIEFFNIKHDDIKNLMELFKPIVKELVVDTSSPLNGMKVVLTGTYHDLSREDFITLMKANAATMSTGVSKKTDLVVVGENPGAGKITKGKSLGIDILTVEEFDSKYFNK